MAKDKQLKKRKILIAGLIAGGGLIVVAVTVTLVLTLGNDPEPQLNRVVVTANQGALVGNVTPQAAMFFGVPFSQPPLGQYRWRNPREPVAFPGAYWDATYFRPSCMQGCGLPAGEVSCPEETDEDCLYLNVWAPSRLMKDVEGDDVIDGNHYVIDENYQTGDENSLAVMVFFYGGNFQVGSASVPLYDMRFMADQGNIVGVGVNYRLGALGYLVQGSGDDAAKGNFGIWDQIRALEWVQRNIKYFGGNPNRVTVFGQSAGAESIGVLQATPYVKDRPDQLFHQAIHESNPFALPFRDWDNAKKFGARFAEAANCEQNDMTCLRNLDISVVMDAYYETRADVVGFDKLFLIFQPWSPVIDGDFLLEQPVDAFGSGNVMTVPSIMGGVFHEAESYIYGAFREAVSNAEYSAIIYAIMKRDAIPILEKYPPTCGPDAGASCDNRQALSYLTTGYLFLCPTRYSLYRTDADTYYYLFNETWSFYELWEFPPCNDKVCHASELPYVFNIANLTRYSMTPEEEVLSQRMVYYWTNFAKYGNPNGDPSQAQRLGQLTDGSLVDAVYWPKFNETGNGTYHTLHISAKNDFVMTDFWDDICDFTDSLDCYADH